ncbi:MAG: hypothetical protein JXP34_29190 [Planctomycetes bacterium]|nr:hypothetical protein [Planctomycetota bacterium]
MMARMAAARILWAGVAIAACGVASAADFEMGPNQMHALSMEEWFTFSSTAERVLVRHFGAMYNCCLEFAVRGELVGRTVRIIEVDQGPPCRCADIPWNVYVGIVGLPPGSYDVLVYDEAEVLLASATIVVPPADEALFVRGRINAGDAIDIADAVALLDYLFAESAAPACLDAGDVNDSGEADLGDAVYLLSYLFASGPAPRPPFPDPGLDPTADDVVCLLEDVIEVRDFVRGDVDGDGQVTVADCVRLTSAVTGPGPALGCPDAGDVNDDGKVDMNDVTALCLPIGPFDLLPPPVTLGPDPTPDRLECK